MKTNFNKVSMLAMAFASVAVMTPTLAFARGNGIDDGPNHHVNENVNDDHGQNHGLAVKSDFKGQVTAVSTTGFTMKTRAGNTITVNTETAQLLRKPNTTITIADIKVGDEVVVMGTKVDSTNITAITVYDKVAKPKRVEAQGIVTAKTDTSLTIQGKHGSTTTITTNGDTKVTEKGTAITLADIEVGNKVKVEGLWDKILNIFTALKIRVK